MRLMSLLGIAICLYHIGFSQDSPTTLPLSEVATYNAYRLNSDEHEFSPMYFQEGIVYVAAHTNTTAANRKPPFFGLYYAPLSSDGMPSGQYPFSSPSSTLGNEGQASFNAKEDLIYYTTNGELLSEEGQYTMKIYEARKEGNDWLHIVELPINSNAYSNRHPSISPDGHTLYFASNMPGGFGGSDIYMVKKEGTYWGIPQNLGPQINTSENDAFPFIFNNDYLFFSSKGHKEQEDYDIYAVNIEGGIPGNIVPLNDQFNSDSDDFGFILHASGTKGFFSSNREGGFGKDDIYLYEVEGNFFPDKNIQEAPALAVVQKHREEIVNQEIKKAPIPKIEQLPASTASTDVPNTIQKETTALPVKEKSEPSIKLSKEAIVTTTPIVKADEATPSNKEAIAQKTELSELTTEEKKKPAESINTTATNTSKEAQPTTSSSDDLIASTTEVLVEKSVQCATLQGVITSATGSPIRAATVQVRSSCGGLPYALTTNQEGAFESCLPINCQYIIAGSKEGYQNNDLLLTVNNTSILSKTITLAAIDKKTISYTAPLSESIQSGDVIEIPSLRYDLEVGRILSTENGVLHQLISLLQRHPKMTIEVVEHTDARGSAYYNFELSQARATIVKNHIIQQGNINSKRIKAIGMGEQQLKNHCNGVVLCSNEEHQANKRTEIRIISMGKSASKSY